MPGPAEGSRRHRPAVLVLYWTLVVLLILLVPEGTIRLLRLQGDISARPDPRFGWFHIPGKRGYYISPQARARFAINSLGLVGPERPYAASPGHRRVLLLGDSFTEALQVPYERSWAHLLEQRLGDGWEVLNGGVAGYGTDNELLFLREEGWRYRPDVVFLLFFTGNDVSDDDHELSIQGGQSLPKPYFVLEADSLRLRDFPVPSRPAHSSFLPKVLKENSRFYVFARTRIFEWRALRRMSGGTEARVPLAWEVYRKGLTPGWERAWRTTAELLRLVKREADRHGVPLVVGVLPTGWRVDAAELPGLLRKYPVLGDSTSWDFSGPDRRLGEILAAEGIPGVQLASPLVEAARREGVRMYGDHLTPRGHEIVAEEAARAILENLPAGRR